MKLLRFYNLKSSRNVIEAILRFQDQHSTIYLKKQNTKLKKESLKKICYCLWGPIILLIGMHFVNEYEEGPHPNRSHKCKKFGVTLNNIGNIYLKGTCFVHSMLDYNFSCPTHPTHNPRIIYGLLLHLSIRIFCPLFPMYYFPFIYYTPDPTKDVTIFIAYHYFHLYNATCKI